MNPVWNAAKRARDRLREAGALWASIRREQRACRFSPIARVETDQASPADAVRWLGPIGLGGDSRHALFCHPQSTVTYRLLAAPGERFTAGCALLPHVWERNRGGVEFSASIAGPAGGPSAARTILVDPGRSGRHRRWRQLSVEVPIQQPQAVTLTLRTTVPRGASPAHAWAIWGEPALVRRRPVSEMFATLRRACRQAAVAGPRAAVRRLRLRYAADEGTSAYRRWAERRAPAASDLAKMAADAAALAWQPLISVITPVYNTDPATLRACIASVRAQVYPNWELCLCDDASTSGETRAVLREQSDPRVRTRFLERNVRISGASNAALEIARGEFIALLDHDDELTPDALYRAVAHLNSVPDADVVYSDEDKRDEDGGVSEPFFKPDWSPEHLLSAMYTCHLTVARRSIVDRAGGFRVGYEGSQDHDLMLRISELTQRIAHLPHVLYHWRRTPQSTASAGSAKPWADDAGRRALEDHVRHKGIDAEVISGGVPGLYRVKFKIRGEPAITIVVTAAHGDVAAAEACAAALRANTEYRQYEIVTVSGEPASLSALVNAAVQAGSGAHLVVLDSALRPSDAGWLTAMLEYSQQDAIGAVGARVEYADGRLRHIGMVTRTEGGPSRPFHGHPATTYGYFSSAIGVRNYAAVSGECLMTRRAIFDQTGGFDESVPWDAADVDYCVRVRHAGMRVVFTPYARLIRPASWLSPGVSTEGAAVLRDIWGTALDDDPYYNPNLSRRSADYLLDD